MSWLARAVTCRRPSSITRSATRLNSGLPEPYFGLGRCLLDSDRAADAVGPLETAARLAPGNPTVHFTLAHAYQELGRKDDAAREFALQKSAAEKIQHDTETVKRNVSGCPTPASGGK